MIFLNQSALVLTQCFLPVALVTQFGMDTDVSWMFGAVKLWMVMALTLIGSTIVRDATLRGSASSMAACY